MNSNKTKTSVGVTFCELLTLVFIVLKLCGVVSWSWWLVLCPLWIGALVALVIAVVILIIWI